MGQAAAAFRNISRAVDLEAFAAATSVSAVSSALLPLLKKRADDDTVAEAAVLVTAVADLLNAHPERFTHVLMTSFRDNQTSPTQRLATDYAAGLIARARVSRTPVAPSAVRALLATVLASPRPEVKVLSHEPPILVIDGVVGDAETASSAASLFEHATQHLVLRDDTDHTSVVLLCPPHGGKASLGLVHDAHYRAIQPSWSRDVNNGQCGRAEPPLAHHFGNGSHLGKSVHFERRAAPLVDRLELVIATLLFGDTAAAMAVAQTGPQTG